MRGRISWRVESARDGVTICGKVVIGNDKVRTVAALKSLGF